MKTPIEQSKRKTTGLMLGLLMTFLAASLIAVPISYASDNMWNDAYGRNDRSGRYSSNNKSTNTSKSNKNTTNSSNSSTNKKESTPSTSKSNTSSPKVTTSTSKPSTATTPSTTTATVAVASKTVVPTPAQVLPPDTALITEKVATEQAQTKSLPVTYATKKIDVSVARTVVMAGTVSALFGGMVVTFSYLPFANRYRTLSPAVS